MQRTIMAVGAHADDIEIGYGGTLFKYHECGYHIVYVQATNNMSGPRRYVRSDGSVEAVPHPPLETMRYRKAECDAAAAMFGTRPIHFDHPQRHYHREPQCGRGALEKRELRYGEPRPAGVAEDLPTILTAHEDEPSIQRVTDLILECAPEVIFTHGFAEKNVEHHATVMLVIKGYWRAVEAGYGGSLLHVVNRFEQLGRFNCQWETWVDVSDHVEARMAALRKHESQFPPGFERGIEHWRAVLAARGSACGVGAAEVFNFVNPAEANAADGGILSELLQNRAPQGTAWGAAACLTSCGASIG